MPAFIPDYSKGYYDRSLYQRYRSQAYKEDLWAAQYFYLVREAPLPIDNFLVTATVPAGMPTYAVMTYLPGDTAEETASNKFFHERKLEMTRHIAGGEMKKPPVLCTESDCTLGFPVDKPKFVADALMSFGI